MGLKISRSLADARRAAERQATGGDQEGPDVPQRTSESGRRADTDHADRGPDRSRADDEPGPSRSPGRTDRSEETGRSRGDRNDGPDRPDHGTDRPERSEQTERRPERSDRPDRRPERRSERSERTERRPERSERSERSGERDGREGEDSGSADGNRSGGSRPVRPSSTRHLRAHGPVVARFHGKVEKVFGTSQRAKPSLRPLFVAAALLAIALVLPYAVALLPVIVIVVVLLLWLRRKGWVRGGMRRPRFGGPTPDAGLQTVTFRVQIFCDDGKTPFTVLNCRLVQKAEAGPVPLASGDTVTGRGRRAGGSVTEVSRLDVGASGTTTLNATSPKSDAPILVLAGLVAVGAAALLYLRWDTIPPISWESVLYPLLSALVPLIAIYVIVKKVILRR